MLPIVVRGGPCSGRGLSFVHHRDFVRNIDVHHVGQTNVSVPIFTRAAVSYKSALRLINLGGRIRSTTGRLKCVSHPAGTASVVFMKLNVLLKNVVKTLTVRVNKMPVDLDADKKTLVTKLMFN